MQVMHMGIYERPGKYEEPGIAEDYMDKRQQLFAIR